MIARPGDGSLLLITQPDHAHLAAAIIEHSVALNSHPRREAILLAVNEHDNGWAEEDAAPMVDPSSGRIADFVHAPLAVRHRVWPRAVGRLDPHPWSAALVAEHAVVVYDRFRTEPGWAPFFEGMEAARDRMVQKSGAPVGELSADYRFLRLADLISLAFCMASSDTHHFADWTVRLGGDRVVVSPNPFGGVTIPIQIYGRELRDQTFRSDAELRAAVKAAKQVKVTGTVSGPQ